MNFAAIIFDLDGVICSTDQYHYQAWKKIADSIDVYFDEVINNRLRGVSRMESLDIILENYSGNFSAEEKKKLAEEKNNIYRDLLNQMSEQDISDEVKETLNALHFNGMKLAIGSSSKNAKFILEKLGIRNFFDAISDGTNITKSKPDPEVFLKAAEYLSIDIKDCLVVEDAKAGILAAHNGGFCSAGIGEAAESEYVTYPLRTFSDLLKI